jgi:transcriptional regulator with XRE-family HTH domain
LIRSARNRAGLTQVTLAQRAREPQSVVSAYERGRRQPSAAAFNRLIEAAGFRLIIVPAPRPGPDPRRTARDLADALALAEMLPARRRRSRLDVPRLPS